MANAPSSSSGPTGSGVFGPPESATASHTRPGLGLRMKILALVFVCVLAPVLSMGVYLLQRNETVLREKVNDTLSSHLAMKAGQIDDWLQERVRDAQHWSSSFVVYEGVETLARSRREHRRIKADLRAYLESVLGRYDVYESLFIVDEAGRTVAGTREEDLGPWGRDQLRKGTPSSAVVSPLHLSEHLKRPTLLVLQPVRGRSGAVIGCLVERVNVKRLESLLGEQSGGLQLDYWLLDRQGNVLIAPDGTHEQPGREPFSALRGAGPEHEEVGETEIPARGHSVYALRRMPGRLPGFLAATVPMAAAYGSLTEAQRRLLKVGVPVMLAILLLNLVAAQRLVGPLLLLSEGAKRVASGDLDVELPVRGRDEIAGLTRVFNEMTTRLREGRSSLEQAHDDLARTNEELRYANQALETLAITDALTGLYNRRHFLERIDAEIRRAARGKEDLSLLLLDIDHFKRFNDCYGHSQGDTALRLVSHAITQSIRTTDTAFRYGGEEIAVLLPGCGKEQAAEVAEKIRSAVRDAEVGPVPVRLSVSVGVATCPEDGRVPQALIDVADVALYSAKAHGRDRVAVAGVKGSSPAPSPS